MINVRRTAALTVLMFLLSAVALAKAKSVVLLIGDGMGPEQVRAASIKLHGSEGKLVMQSAPVSGSLRTRSMDSDVTDSAAAGTALATGRKTNNGVISMSAGGTRLKTILEVCRDAGKATGLVATSTITHATPAAFGSHVENRSSEDDIAAQLIQTRVNVLFGGGKSFFTGATGGAAESWVGIDVMGADDKKLLTMTDHMIWTDYRAIDRSFLAPSGAKQANVWIWSTGGKVNAYLDDVGLREADEKGKPTGDNLLANSDFENKTFDGWKNWGNLEVEENGGSYALAVTGNGGGAQQVAIRAGGYYAFAYRGRMGAFDVKGKKETPWDAAGKAGYRRIGKKEELTGARGKYVLGLFKDSSLESTEDEPTLAQMTAKALSLVDQDPDGFFVMVEGSQIDWACHDNDEKGYLKQMASFDAAVAAALDFVKKRDDVLVVVAADHETGGMKAESDGTGGVKITFSTGDHTATNVPVFAFGPGSEKFSGEMENTDVSKKIAEALEVSF